MLQLYVFIVLYPIKIINVKDVSVCMYVCVCVYV